MLWERMIPPLEQLSLPQLSVFSPNRAKRHFLDRRDIPRMNPETGVDAASDSKGSSRTLPQAARTAWVRPSWATAMAQ